MNETIETLQSRASTPARMLGEPAPGAAELEQVIQAALAAPDHGGLKPWRFVIIEGQARARLAELYGRTRIKLNPEASAEELENERAKPFRSPMIIAVCAVLDEAVAKVPVVEQIVSAGAAAQNILLALDALGYGAILLTGGNAYDDDVKALLGLAPKDAIVGFIHTGTPTRALPKKRRASPADHMVRLDPA